MNLDQATPAPRTHRISYLSRLPFGHVTERQVSGRCLFLDPERACWLALPAPDAVILRHLLSGATIGEAVARCADPSKVSGVVTQVIRAGFFGDRADGFAGPPVKQVQVHLTNRCNLRCTHCYMDSGVTRVGERPLSQWLDLLDKISERWPHVFVAFSGGEPLVSQSLFPLLERASERGIKTAILTNGLRLDEPTVSRLDGLLDVCAVSLDGLSAATHDLIRGEGTFEKTIAALRRMGPMMFRKVLNITVLQHNKDEIETGLRPFVDSLGYRVDIDLGSLVLEGRGLETASLAVPPADFRKVLTAARRAFINMSSSQAPTVGTDNTVVYKTVPPRVRNNCGYGETLVIYSDGGVSTCLTPRFIRGNVFDDGASGLLDAIDAEREAARVNSLPECHVCDLRHVCGGRCHLPQLRLGQMPHQVACSDRYKESMFRNLVEWGSSA